MNYEQKKEYAALAGILALVAVLSLLSLPLPPGRDQGIFLYHAKGLLAGLTPYIDMWDHKPPGIYFLYAGALLIFGDGYQSINYLDWIWRLLTTVAMFLAGRSIWGSREGLIAALFYGLATSMYGTLFWWIAQPDGFMALPLALSVWLAQRKTVGSDMWAGGTAALAIWLKTTALLPALIILLWIYKTPGPKPHQQSKARITNSLYVFMGMLVPIPVYLLLSQSFGAFWDMTFLFNLHHGTIAADMGIGIETLLLYLALPLLLTPIAFSSSAQINKSTDPEIIAATRKRTIWTGVWGLSILITIIVQRKYFLYHFFPLAVPVGLLGARGAICLLEYIRSTPPEGEADDKSKTPMYILTTVFWAIFMVIACSLQWSEGVMQHGHYRTIPYLQGEITEREYYSRFAFVNGDFSFLDDMDTADYLRKNTDGNDSVLVFGFEPLIYFLSDRFPPTRFNSDYPLTFEPHMASLKTLREGFRSEFIEDIQNDPPAYIVIVSRDTHPLDKVPSDIQAREFTAFHKIVTDDYVPDITIGDMALYRLKSKAGVTGK